MNRLSRISRVMTLVAAVLLGGVFVAPLWSISLLAPQYPEGLGMLIRLNAIDGVKENDLRNINSLNHYIGMRPIEASAIPELRYMPWIAAGLIVTGVLVALIGRRRLLAAWVTGFAALGVAGLYDFWRWGYSYGHNLDVENAIITVPGMTYQPPLIGTKQLLNFTATSWPDVGGVLAGVAFALGLIALVIAYRQRVTLSSSVRTGVLAAATMACAAGPHVIRLGIDVCSECRMLLSDARFGAQVVTRTGKTLTFDSIECMNKFVADLPAGTVREVWVVDANHPGTLIRWGDASERHDGILHPPMGATYTVATADAR